MQMMRDDVFIDCNAATVAALGYDDIDQFLNTHPAETSPEIQPEGKRVMSPREFLAGHRITAGVRFGMGQPGP